MKILAFSDWRAQSLARLRGVIESQDPDILLYAGNGLNRFFGIETSFYVKTYNNFIKASTDHLKDVFSHEKLSENPRFKTVMEEVQNYASDFLTHLDIPFMYVNGNDDYILNNDGNYYLRLFESLWIESTNYYFYETLEGKVDVYPSQNYGQIFFDPEYIKKVIKDQEKEKGISTLKDDYENNDRIFSYMKDNGVYVKINPSLGKTDYTVNGDHITLFGIEYSSGNKEQCIRSPDEYADIFLSHLPPLGTLDLIEQWGVKHVGSKRLLEAIHTNHPKIVICGHTSLWGGKVEHINDTCILNVSSQNSPPSQTNGHYALIDTEDWSYHMHVTPPTNHSKVFLTNIKGVSWIRNQLKQKGRLYLPEHLKHIMFSRKKDDTYQDIQDFFNRIEHSKNLFYAEFFGETSMGNLTTTVENFITDELSIDLTTFRKEAKNAESLFKKSFKELTIEEACQILDAIQTIGINIVPVKRRIKTLQDKKVKLLKRLSFNPNNYYFIKLGMSLSNTLHPRSVWLITLVDGQTENITQFIYPQESSQFFEYLRGNSIAKLVSWRSLDHKALKPILKGGGIRMKFYDAYKRSSNCVAWHSYKLHDLYDTLFPERKTPSKILPGKVAGLYANHLIFDTTICPYCSHKKEQIINEIKRQNRHDILQMIKICKCLYFKKNLMGA